MDDYKISTELASKVLTQTFSNSFSSAISLFSKNIRQDIYNIYGLVRIADEVVDTYKGSDAGKILDELEQEVYASLKRQFSSNIIVHAFALTANKYKIDKSLIEPFFDSMRMDLEPKKFNEKDYKRYIYGSADVVGLMCLKVFVNANEDKYKKLKPGAEALGSAFQKVNFLRDIKEDYYQRGRYYFPFGSFDSFNNETKELIIKDIDSDFNKAKKAILKLPNNSKFAVKLAFDYYYQLLIELKKIPAEKIKQKRLSVGKSTKLKLLFNAKLKSHAGK